MLDIFNTFKFHHVHIIVTQLKMATMLNIQMTDTPYTGNMYSHFLLLLKLDNRHELLSIHQEVMTLSWVLVQIFQV